jgi:hypothetical protein
VSATGQKTWHGLAHFVVSDLVTNGEELAKLGGKLRSMLMGDLLTLRQHAGL